MRKGVLAGAALLLAVVSAPATATAKGGDYITPTCWGDAATVAACDGARVSASAGPKFGDYIKFEFKTQYYDAVGGSGPWLQLKCYRAGADGEYDGQTAGSLILADSRAGFPGGYGYGEPFVLEGTAWTLGPADCITQVGHRTKSGKFMVDASTSYAVTG